MVTVSWLIQDILPLGVKLNIPPFLGGDVVRIQQRGKKTTNCQFKNLRRKGNK